jgi:hypothetical protein
MSFFVTLVSNASKSNIIFPDNCLNNYTNILEEEIHLDQKYEVSLHEIMYPINWKFDKYANILVRKDGFMKIYPVSFNALDNIDDVFYLLNNKFKNDSLDIIFSYGKDSKLVSIQLDAGIEIEFENDFQIELGFRANLFEAPPNKHTYYGYESIPYELNNIKSLFVYSDICERQFVGDYKEPLLRTITVENSHKFGDYVNASFKQVHYVPVCKDSFKSIQIYICDDTGSLVHFSAGKIIATLHFRKRIHFI